VWLERAVVNLLTNAVRFTPDGGAVSVTVGPTGGAVRICVCDTGVGIDPAALGEIFEPFSRACGDIALHASGGFDFGARGLGLGLSITRAIVQEHDGTIGARSQLGAGSAFTITLPSCERPGEGGPPIDALSP
jgi:signal transduction histidine kinase